MHLTHMHDAFYFQNHLQIHSFMQNGMGILNIYFDSSNSF